MASETNYLTEARQLASPDQFGQAPPEPRLLRAITCALIDIAESLQTLRYSEVPQRVMGSSGYTASTHGGFPGGGGGAGGGAASISVEGGAGGTASGDWHVGAGGGGTANPSDEAWWCPGCGIHKSIYGRHRGDCPNAKAE